ncbi:MAG TPA: DmsE family decaheme c-type cytochrome [Telluria sp.]|nr:DmsE family decaheme c-type cytochrome [Telluria sp.]
MNLWHKIAAMLVLAVGMAAGPGAFAAEPAAPALTASAAARALEKDAVCTKCHDESESRPILAMYKTRHGVKADTRTPGCQSCHGTSEAHVKNAKGSSTRPAPDRMFVGPNKSDAKAINETCASCHKGGKRHLWDGSKHESSGLACVSCHAVHTAGKDKVLEKSTQKEVCFACHKTERSETLRHSTHPLQAGKMACSDCHNPHGSEGPKLMKEASVRDTCFTCHAEKRGPFLYEHPSAMDDCMNCHTPHGSTNAPLLKARAPYLCQSCHAEMAQHPGNMYSAASLPGGKVANANTRGPLATAVNPVTGAGPALNNPAAQLAFRGCNNCHTQVHGSNHPAGKRLVR